MSDGPDSEALVVDESVKKKKKAKKRPSDFEIARTILQRTHERKLPYVLKSMGEDPDILFFCSKDEKEFTYGSPDITVAILEISDPELQTIVTSLLEKFHGFHADDDRQRVVNVRDQISEISRTKGESLDVEIHTNPEGSAWVLKPDPKGQDKPSYFCMAIDSLFHMQLVKSWCKSYRPLLASDDPSFLYYPYKHPEGPTGSILTLPPTGGDNHPIGHYYPHGFRNMVTRGLDVLISKCLEDFPYPIIQEDLIVFQDQSVACQIAHRIIAQGWRMVLVRPNAVHFPTLDIPLMVTGHQGL